MGSMSLVHWLVVAALALLLFGGRGKLSSIMKDAAEGIKGFRKGLADDPAPSGTDAAKVNDATTIDVSPTTKSKTDA